MKYYLFEATSYNSGEKDSIGVYTYDNPEEAVANFHSKMGVAMKNQTYASELLVVLNSDGLICKIEKFVRKAADAEVSNVDNVTE